MRKTALVARREYQALVRTKAFIISLVVMPVLMFGMIAVQSFLSGRVDISEKKVVVRQETKFPESDTTQLKFKCEKPAQFALKIRWPAWSDALSVRVNGKKQKISGPYHPACFTRLMALWQQQIPFLQRSGNRRQGPRAAPILPRGSM